MNPKVTVFGSFVVDLMARGDHLPVPGETVKGSLFRMGPGGKGFNQGVAAHLAGANVTMVTKLGRDQNAEIALTAMNELGMDNSFVMFSEETETGAALIIVEEKTSQNMILVVSGACDTFNQADIDKIKPLIEESQYLLTQLETNLDAVEKVVDIAHQSTTRVILNPAPFQPVSDHILSLLYLITPNETEAEKLTGIAVVDQKSAQAAANWFFAKGVQNVVITMGSQGAYVNTRDREGLLPVPKVNVVDSTGAGDAFNGGLLTALAEGKTIWESAVFANALAALSVQRLGTTPAMPTRAEIDAFQEHPFS